MSIGGLGWVWLGLAGGLAVDCFVSDSEMKNVMTGQKGWDGRKGGKIFQILKLKWINRITFTFNLIQFDLKAYFLTNPSAKKKNTKMKSNEII